MCCFLTTLVLLGPRIAILIGWLIWPGRFAVVFNNWLVPLLMAIFIPWTMIMYVLVFPIVGLDWLWLGLGLLADIAFYAGGGFRRRVPGYSGTY